MDTVLYKFLLLLLLLLLLDHFTDMRFNLNSIDLLRTIEFNSSYDVKKRTLN